MSKQTPSRVFCEGEKGKWQQSLVEEEKEKQLTVNLLETNPLIERPWSTDERDQTHPFLSLGGPGASVWLRYRRP